MPTVQGIAPAPAMPGAPEPSQTAAPDGQASFGSKLKQALHRGHTSRAGGKPAAAKERSAAEGGATSSQGEPATEAAPPAEGDGCPFCRGAAIAGPATVKPSEATDAVSEADAIVATALAAQPMVDSPIVEPPMVDPPMVDPPIVDPPMVAAATIAANQFALRPITQPAPEPAAVTPAATSGEPTGTSVDVDRAQRTTTSDRGFDTLLGRSATAQAPRPEGPRATARARQANDPPHVNTPAVTRIEPATVPAAEGTVPTNEEGATPAALNATASSTSNETVSMQHGRRPVAPDVAATPDREAGPVFGAEPGLRPPRAHRDEVSVARRAATGKGAEPVATDPTGETPPTATIDTRARTARAEAPPVIEVGGPADGERVAQPTPAVPAQAAQATIQATQPAVGAGGPAARVEAPTSSGAPAPVATEHVAPVPIERQVVEALKILPRTEGQHEVRMVLNPPELGEVHVRMVIRDDAASVYMGTQTDAAREAIQAALPQLREVLQARGLEPRDLEVSLGGGRANTDTAGTNTNDRQPEERRDAQDRPTRAPAIAPPGRQTTRQPAGGRHSSIDLLA